MRSYSRDTRVKRDEMIDRLIGSPDYVEHWTNKWADLLQVNRKYLGVEGATARVGEEGGERPARLYDTVQWAWVSGIRDGTLSLPRLPMRRVDDFRHAFDAVAVTFEGTYATGADGRVARARRPEDLLGLLHRLADACPDRPLWVAGHLASVGDPAGDAEEAEQAVARSAFAFPAMALPVSQVAETGKSSFPGDKDFQDALAALPPGLAEKLRSTLGAEFTALRPVPAGKLRRPV